MQASRRGFLLGGATAIVSLAVPVVAVAANAPVYFTPHRWLATYDIGSDSILVRADYCFTRPLKMPRGGLFQCSNELIEYLAPKMRDGLMRAAQLALETGGQYHVDMALTPLEAKLLLVEL